MPGSGLRTSHLLGLGKPSTCEREPQFAQVSMKSALCLFTYLVKLALCLFTHHCSGKSISSQMFLGLFSPQIFDT